MSALWKNCEVENVICRKSKHVERFGYKPHGVFLIVRYEEPYGNSWRFATRAVRVPILDHMEWERWSQQRIKAVMATAPSTVDLIVTRSSSNRYWLDTTKAAQWAWVQRIREHMNPQVQKTMFSVA